VVQTDTTPFITASPIGRTDILVIMYSRTSKLTFFYRH